MRPSSTERSPAVAPREELLARYHRNRARTSALFGLLRDEAYYDQPIALRHPLVFYVGHLPAFSFNTLVKRALGLGSIDPVLERLFARGIDPSDSPPESDGRAAPARWPDLADVRAFVKEADRRVVEALTLADLDRPGHPLLDRSEAAFAILEHEEMHQETLLYLFHRLPYDRKKPPAEYRPEVGGGSPAAERIEIPPGRATLGVGRRVLPFAWDNECPEYAVTVPAFDIDRHDVSNARFLDFVEAGGYRDPRWWTSDDWAWLRREGREHPGFWERRDDSWYWRGMFGAIPLPPAWPVYVSHAEASAFTRWLGSRLPTEAEFQRAAYGSSDGERTYAWGDEPPGPGHGAFDFSTWDPVPAGSRPAGASAWGVEDLVGNGWEWTSSEFGPFPGFRPIPSYPEYSADFFDEGHYVLKGASPATARDLLRPTFRNWFRPRYPYVYATFRSVHAA